MMARIQTSIILLLICSVSLCGCGFLPFYAQGKVFRPARTSYLEIGKSTKFDVLRLFGEPLERDAVDLNKANVWRYNYEYLGNLGVERAELELTFKDYILTDLQKNIQISRY